MYDSRTDKARKPKDREPRTDYDAWEEQYRNRNNKVLRGRPQIKREVTAEIMAEIVADTTVGGLPVSGLKGLKKIGPATWERRMTDWRNEPLADWEQEVLNGEFASSTCDFTDCSCQYSLEDLDDLPDMDDDVDDLDDAPYVEEPLADWERELLNGDPEYPYYGERDEEYESDFLPVLTISEAFQNLGDDGWHIEGPRAYDSTAWMREHEWQRKEHYTRVYELARTCGVPSNTLVRELRLSGTFVKTHMSLVANPVAQRLINQHNA